MLGILHSYSSSNKGPKIIWFIQFLFLWFPGYPKPQTVFFFIDRSLFFLGLQIFVRYLQDFMRVLSGKLALMEYQCKA